MRIYYVVLLISLILMFVLTRFKVDGGTLKYSLDGYIGERSWIEIILMGLPMIIFSSIQYGVGADYFEYVNIVYNAGEKIEFFCRFLCNYFFSYLGNSQWFFVFTSIVIVWLFLSTIFKFSKLPVISAYIFIMTGVYTNITFNLIRYGVAIAFIFYSYRFIESRDLKKFLLCMVCAMGFHRISVIFVPVYWLYILRWNYITLWGMTFCVFILRQHIGDMIMFLGELTKYYNSYVDTYFASSPLSFMGTFVQLTIIISSIVYCEDNKRLNFYILCEFIATWFGFVSYWLPEVYRFRTMFTIFGILLIPEVFIRIKNKGIRFCYAIFVVCCYAWMGRRLGEYGVGQPLVNSYQTIFDVGLSLF